MHLFTFRKNKNMKKRSNLAAAFILSAVAFTGFMGHKKVVSTAKIGEQLDGGIVFKSEIGADGVQHGLMVCLTDLSAGAGWGKTSVATGATSKTDGKSNTAKIIEAGGTDKEAAGIAKKCEAGGHKDWYLPAQDEMQLLYNEREKVNAGLAAANGIKLAPEWYWTSTENMKGSAWGMDLSDGSASSSNKLRNGSVRAIRQF
jgi:hypothetical protein